MLLTLEFSNGLAANTFAFPGLTFRLGTASFSNPLVLIDSRPGKIRLATFGVAHAFDHYGQMVEYLRMNGIIPPASRAKSD